MTFQPSLGISVTQTVREGLRIVMSGVAPCPLCHLLPPAALTLRDVANETGVSASTLSRFLSGRGIESDHLDRLYEFVNDRLPGITR